MTAVQWIGGVAIILALWAILAYNALVRARNRARAAWSQIDVQLKKRHDLIPNLVAAVGGYLKHERETLEAVTGARRLAVVAASSPGSRAEAENALSGGLRSLWAVVERYPDLKAAATVRDLMEQLTTVESRIAFSRQHYNDSVLALNTMATTFPRSLVARAFGFGLMEYFRLEVSGEGRAVDVSFGGR